MNEVIDTPVADAAPVDTDQAGEGHEEAETDTVTPETAGPAVQAPAAPQVAPAVTDAGLARLQAWTSVAYEVSRLGTSLANTQFVPQAMRKKPAEVTAAILTGAELGLDPMASLRSIVVIQGTPTLTAHAMRALVMRSGHRVRVIEADEGHAVVHGWRSGEFDQDPHVSVWDLERAKRLGLLRKDNWQTMPQNMLIARATAEACRLTAPDALTAAPYSTEEMADEHDVALAPARRARAGAKRKPVTVPEPEALPPAPGNAGTEAEPKPAAAAAA